MSSTASTQSRAPGVDAAISVRRFANDEIARVGSNLDAGERKQFEFLCECGDLSCRQFVRMTVAEYRATSPGSVSGHSVPGGADDPVASAKSMPDAATLAAANRHIYIHVRDSDDGEQEWEFLCECGNDDCHERVMLTIDAYISLHDHGEAVLASDHQVNQLERARRLRTDAQALRRQASHQVNRAIQNLGISRDLQGSDDGVS